jgi:hypothetical protein
MVTREGRFADRVQMEFGGKFFGVRALGPNNGEDIGPIPEWQFPLRDGTASQMYLK